MKTVFLALVLVGVAGTARAALTAEEQQVSQSLSPEAQKRYAATREYLHRAQKVVDQQIAPISLGRRPTSYDASYITADEKAVIDQAVELSNIALINGVRIA